MDEKTLLTLLGLTEVVFKQAEEIGKLSKRLTAVERYLRLSEVGISYSPDHELSKALDAELHRQLDAYHRSQAHKPSKPLDFED